ncbi:hypothetical protein EGW08_016089 [Elysia chlorotica]|uniref:Uncharacterized protein n=1 Tax=Elysia chlorotica TaxID=188477 RepID=A0A433T3Q1_ELYCH|nr:hypothetical protein EGW08_016089 [Elysia chlorotica]
MRHLLILYLALCVAVLSTLGQQDKPKPKPEPEPEPEPAAPSLTTPDSGQQSPPELTQPRGSPGANAGSWSMSSTAAIPWLSLASGLDWTTHLNQAGGGEVVPSSGGDSSGQEKKEREYESPPDEGTTSPPPAWLRCVVQSSPEAKDSQGIAAVLDIWCRYAMVDSMSSTAAIPWLSLASGLDWTTHLNQAGGGEGVPSSGGDSSGARKERKRVEREKPRARTTDLLLGKLVFYSMAIAPPPY